MKGCSHCEMAFSVSLSYSVNVPSWLMHFKEWLFHISGNALWKLQWILQKIRNSFFTLFHHGKSLAWLQKTSWRTFLLCMFAIFGKWNPCDFSQPFDFYLPSFDHSMPTMQMTKSTTVHCACTQAATNVCTIFMSILWCSELNELGQQKCNCGFLSVNGHRIFSRNILQIVVEMTVDHGSVILCRNSTKSYLKWIFSLLSNPEW